MLQIWRYPTGRLCLLLLIGLVVFDVWAAYYLSISVPVSNVFPALLSVVLLAFVWAIGEVVARRLPNLAKGVGYGLMNISVSLAYFVVWNTAGIFATYFAAAFRMPLQDDALASADRFFGFDWLAFLQWVNASPAASYVLCWAYLSMIPQMLFAIALFAFSRHSEKVWDFFALTTTTLVVTTALSGAFPALAAYVHYAPAPDAYSLLETIIPDVGRDYISHVTALHHGTLTEFDIGSMTGIISFPSYHAIVGIILVYTAIRFELFVVPAIILNAAMVVAIMPVGGHHMVDAFGSVAVFGVCLAAVNRYQQLDTLEWSPGWLGRPARASDRFVIAIK